MRTQTGHSSGARCRSLLARPRPSPRRPRRRPGRGEGSGASEASGPAFRTQSAVPTWAATREMGGCPRQPTPPTGISL